MALLKNFSTLWQDRSYRIAFLLTLFLFSVALALFLLKVIGYQWVLFILLPFVTGMTTGLLPNQKKAIFGLCVATIAFLVFLMLIGFEGVICIILSLPILALSAYAGIVAVRQIRKRRPETDSTSLPGLLLPLFVFLFGAGVENSLPGSPQTIETVKTVILLPYTTQQVYDAIKSVDTLDVEKPFLLQVGLPVPEKCILEQELVGATRTCYFESGRIVERITELDPARMLRMDVIDYEVLGLKWLKFHEAIYTFEPQGNKSTKLTRITTYSSALKPRFYWAPLEKLGISQEHDYVFRNLQKDLFRQNAPQKAD